VPADYVMDAASAKTLRDYVSADGTVQMTAFSAKVDENGQWFNTPLPGRLSDVFGLKTNAFYNTPRRWLRVSACSYRRPLADRFRGHLAGSESPIGDSFSS
jgi:beta-galactosidase GanA